MSIHLTIEASDVAEFDSFIARFVRNGETTTDAIMPEVVKAAVSRKGKTADKGEVAAQPAAAAADPMAGGGAPAVEATGGEEITKQMLQTAMSELIGAKSASAAQAVLLEASGVKSLSSGSPNVMELGATDPSILKKVYDALVAAKTA